LLNKKQVLKQLKLLEIIGSFGKFRGSHRIATNVYRLGEGRELELRLPNTYTEDE
jgi:hypothetical protein